MNEQRWQKIEEIFQSAVDLAPAERDQFISAQCADDAELRDEVEKLLADYDSADSFIESPVWTRNQFLIPTEVDNAENPRDKHFKELLPDPMLGRQIGAYRLAKEIGRGGMGAVYMAERADGSFRQQVAIKLIKRGMDTDFILRRFRQERQILAALNHPFIARLLDGGTTSDGLPFFVMEFIEGKPLYRFCDQNKLSINERLKLFRQICQAIDFAHQNKVIHRDIKPPNILITSDGTPKLLDFGIAKVLDPELSFDTIDPTATAMRLMTPEYASPEQVCGGDITPASDIYSLGVLLYELLTGHRPYSFQNRAPHEIARVICEEEPEPPGTGIAREDNLLPAGATEATTLFDLCRLRGASNIEDLRRELSGDIENIVLKSLRKEPKERYQTVAEFAQDITNYLQGKPVIAEKYLPPTVKAPAPYAAGEKSLAVLPLKIINLTPNIDTGEEFLSVGLADAIITRLSGVSRLAVRPTSTVLRYGDDSVNPLQAGKDLSVDFVLDGRIKILGKKIRVTLQLLDVQNSTSVWANQFDEMFTDALELEDSISHQVIEAILPQLTETERQKINKRGTENPKAFESYLRGRYYWNQFTPDSLPKALDAFQKAVALDPNYALAYVGIADFYLWGNIYGILPAEKCFPPAQEALNRALELDAELGEAYAARGLIASNFFEWKESERFHQKAIEKNPNYPHAHEWYAALLVGTGRFEEGIIEIKRAEELDALSLRTMTMTAWTLYQSRRFEESLAKAKQIVEMDRNYPQGHLQLANNLLELGRFEEAVAAAQKALEMMPQSPLPQYILCFALVRSNRLEQARAILGEMKRQAAAAYVKPYFLAMAQVALGEKDAAFALFKKAFDQFDPWLTWFGTESKLDSIRDDKRFVELFKRTKNPLLERLPNKKQPITNSEKSIAVLPLKLLGTSQNEDTGDDYLRIGLADALITRLSNVRRFVIRPTSSVLPYGKKQINAFEAGRELGVDFVVDGNIRHVGDRIRVSVQLLSVRDNSTHWAQTFDEGLVDVLALEDSISEKIVKSLLPHLTGEEEKRLKKRGTDNREAFEAYLRGRHHWNTFTEDGFAKALIYYNEAIAIAPDYALAYAGIADYFNLLGLYAILPFSETSAAAKEAAQKAIALDSDLAEGYAALGFATLMHDFDWTATEDYLTRAVRLNPNYVTGRVWYAYFLSLKGEYDKALEQIQQALKLDPLTPSVPHARNLTLYYARRFDEAIAATEKLIEREPQYGLSYLFLSSVMWRVARTSEAVALAHRAITVLGRTSYTLPWLAAACAANNQPAEARALLAEIEELSARRHASPCLVAMIYCNLGDEEKALELMEKAWEIRDGRLLWLGVDPQFDALRDNPRLQKILRLTGNPLFKKDADEKTKTPIIFTEEKFVNESPQHAQTAKDFSISEENKAEISKTADSQKSNLRWLKIAAAGTILFLLFGSTIYFLNKYYFSSLASTNRKTNINDAEMSSERHPKDSSSIAVLPFNLQNLYERDTPLSLGLAEILTARLGQIKQLKVRPVGSSSKIPVSAAEALKTGRDLQVDYVLFTQMQKANENFTVEAVLQNTNSGAMSWSEKFPVNAAELSNLPITIAERILKNLNIELSLDERENLNKKYTDNAGAYQNYLAGRYYLNKRKPDDFQIAIKNFEQAVKLDPNFALAYAGLAETYALTHLYQIPPPPDAYLKAKQYAQKALTLDENLPNAHAVLGYVNFYAERDRAGAEREFRRANEINPSYSTAHHWFALVLAAMNRTKEAVTEIETAQSLDERALIIKTAGGIVYFYDKQYDKGIVVCDAALASDNSFVPAYKVKRWIYQTQGNYAAAKNAFLNERNFSGSGDEPGWLITQAQVEALNNPAEARQILQKALQDNDVRTSTVVYGYEIALAYNALSDTENALAWLEKTENSVNYSFNFLPVDPRFDNLRGEPRFNALLKKLKSPIRMY